MPFPIRGKIRIILLSIVVFMAVAAAGVTAWAKFYLPGIIGSRIKEMAAQRYGYRLTYTDISLDFWPWPILGMKGMSLAGNRPLHLTVADVSVAPSLRALVSGRIELARATVDRLVLQARVPALGLPSGGQGGPSTDWRALLARVRQLAPDMTLDIRDSRIELDGPSPQQSLLLTNIDASGTPAALRMKLSCGSNFWQLLAADVNMNSRTLSGKIDLTIEQLDGTKIAPWTPAVKKIQLLGGTGSVDAYAQIEHGALGAAGWKLTAPRLQVAASGQPLEIAQLVTKGGLQREADGRWTLDVADFSTASPSLALSARAGIRTAAGGQPASISLSGTLREVSLSDLRSVGLTVAGGNPTVKDVADVIAAGRLTRTEFRTVAPVPLNEIYRLPNWHIAGHLEDARLAIPGADLKLTRTSGDLTLGDGVLYAQNISAQTEGASARNGTLTLSIENFGRMMAVDVDVAAGIQMVFQTLRQYIQMPELARVTPVSGQVQGHLHMGDSLDNLAVQVSDARMQALLRYNRLPQPIDIRRSTINYEPGRLSVSGATVATGRNQVKGLGLSWSWGSGGALRGELSGGDIDIGQAMAWLARFPAAADRLGKAGLKGHLRLGPSSAVLPAAGAWHIAASGRLSQAVATLPSLPAPVSIPQASLEIDMTPAAMAVQTQQAAFEMLDAAAQVSAGRIQMEQGQLSTLALDLDSAAMGARAADWVWGTMALPPAAKPPATVSLTGGRLAWSRRTGALVQANLNYASGPRLYIDALRTGEIVDVRKLTIADQDSDARMNLLKQKELLTAGFHGHLAGATLARISSIFAQRQQARVSGDLDASINLAPLRDFTVKGNLQARSAALPDWRGQSIVFDDVAVQADGKTVNIVKGDIALNGQPFSLTGPVEVLPQNLQVKLNLSAQEVLYEKIQPLFTEFSGAGAPAPSPAAGPPAAPEQKTGAAALVYGTVAVRIARFTYHQTSIAPLDADVTIDPQGITAVLQNASLCGIALFGSLQTEPGGQVVVHLSPSADRQQLMPMLQCLSLERAALYGTYSLHANLSGAGKPQNLTASLNGPVDFVATKGSIHKFNLLSKILGVLNVTSIFTGQLPDLTTQGLAYSDFQISGSFNSGLFRIDSAVLKGPSLEMAATGTIDVPKSQLNLTVTVAPLRTIDRILKHIPLVGSILGGNLLVIPVGVRGSTADPQIIPIDPAAVGEGLAGILKRTLELPYTLFKLPLGALGNK